jgi:hypothetical protein
MPTPQEIIEAYKKNFLFGQRWSTDLPIPTSGEEFLRQALADYTAYLISVMPEEERKYLDSEVRDASLITDQKIARENGHNSALSHVHDILSNEISKLIS